MRIGVALPNSVADLRPSVVPRWAERAENAGFDVLGTVGRIAFPGLMDTVALAAAAAVTTRVELLSHVLLAPIWPAALLAKEVAGIDGVSGGRLTLGVGVGYRKDDFVVDGHGFRGRGGRFDADLATYHRVWSGEGGESVPAGTRAIPLLFGGMTRPALARAARWGEGFIVAFPSPGAAAAGFEQARAAWKAYGRESPPRLVAIAYFGLADPDAARAGTSRYYAFLGEHAGAMTRDLLASPGAVKEAVRAYVDIGADDLMFLPGTDDLDDLARLADVVL